MASKNDNNLENTNIKKAVEINIIDGKVHVTSALDNFSVIKVLSLAMFEMSKTLSNTKQ